MDDTTKAIAKSVIAGQARTYAAMVVGGLVAHNIIPATDQASATELLASGIVGAIVAAWSWWNAIGRAKLQAHLQKMTGTATPQAAAAVATAAPATPPPAVVALAAKVAGVLLLALVLWPAQGWAQAKPPLSQTLPGPKSGPIHQGLEAIEQGNSPIGQAAKKGTLMDYLADEAIRKISADLQYADALAHQNNNKVTAPCLDAILALIQGWQAPVYPYTPPSLSGAPAAAAPAAAPEALAMPDPHAVVTMERASELLAQLQPNSTLNIGCAATALASQKDITTLLGTILSGGALGLLKLPIIPIP